MSKPYFRFIRYGGELKLRITQDGEIKADYPIEDLNAAFLVAEGALFTRDRMIELQNQQTMKADK